MTNRIRRKSAARIAARLAITVGILAVAALLSQRLSETNAVPVTPDASLPVQYLAYSGQDIWHAFPAGR